MSFVAVVGISNAQLRFIYGNDTINGDTVTVNINPLDDEILFAVNIANLSSQDAALHIVADSTSPNINVAGMCAEACCEGREISFSVPANSVYTEFHATIEVAAGTPNGYSAVIGFEDPYINTPNVNFWVKFVVQSSSVNIAEQAMMQLYPNPAKDFVTLSLQNADLSANAKVQMLNALGAVVKEMPMTSDNMRISVNDMPAGVYACRIADGHNIVATKKIVVK